MSEAEKLQSITRGLLELAQSGFSGTLIYEEVKVDELVYNSLCVAHNVYPKAVIKVDQSLHPANDRKLHLQGNAQLFELAISNVLLNACKYSGEKPVTFAVAQATSKYVSLLSATTVLAYRKMRSDISSIPSSVHPTQKDRGYGIGSTTGPQYR